MIKEGRIQIKIKISDDLKSVMQDAIKPGILPARFKSQYGKTALYEMSLDSIRIKKKGSGWETEFNIYYKNNTSEYIDAAQYQAQIWIMTFVYQFISGHFNEMALKKEVEASLKRAGCIIMEGNT